MSDTQSDNLYRNDNKALSSGSQSADLSRSGGAPAEQQTAPESGSPNREQDSQGSADAGGASARPAPAEQEQSAAEDRPSGGEGDPGGGSPQSPAVSPEPASGAEQDDGQSASRDSRVGGNLDHEGELTLGGRAEWSDLEGGHHSRSGEITVSGATDTNAGLEAATQATEDSGGLVGGPGGLTAGLRDPVEALDTTLDRVDAALTSVSGVLEGAQAALTEAAGEVAGLSLAGPDGLDHAAPQLDAEALASPVLAGVDAATGLPQDLTSGLAEQLPDLDPVISTGGTSGFLTGLFEPGKGDADGKPVGGAEELTEAVSGLLGGSGAESADSGSSDDLLDLGL